MPACSLYVALACLVIVVAVVFVPLSTGNVAPLPRSIAMSVEGRRALVIGGTAGIGAGIARSLAKRGANVTIVGRNAAAGASVVAELQALRGSPAAHNFVQLDASLLKNVKQFSDEFVRTNDKLDYLILCQSVASFGGREPTSEGIPIKLALHYYTRILSMISLAPLLRQSVSPRVLSVLSGGVHAPYTNWDDLDLESYSLKKAADAAGYYSDLGMDRFTRDEPSIATIHAAPGFVASNWGHQTALAPLIKVAQKLFAKSSDQCGDIMVDVLENPAYAKGFHAVTQHGKQAKVTAAHTEDAMTKLWAHTKSVFARVLE